MNDNVIDKMIEIDAVDNDGFLQILETLTRIGLVKRDSERPKLYQTVCCLHKQGKYYLAHFKQMYQLDGRVENNAMSDDDYARLHNVASLLKSWNMVKPKSEVKDFNPVVKTVVVKHSNKGDFDFVQPYKIGGKK